MPDPSMSVDSPHQAQGDDDITDLEGVQNLLPRRLVTAVFCITLCVAGCSNDAPEAIAFAEETPAIAPPEIGDLNAEDLELIFFHAHWICELQRRTFESLDGAAVARSEALELASIAEANYEDFVRVTLREQLVRDAVLFEYQQLCRAE